MESFAGTFLFVHALKPKWASAHQKVRAFQPCTLKDSDQPFAGCKQIQGSPPDVRLSSAKKERFLQDGVFRCLLSLPFGN